MPRVALKAALLALLSSPGAAALPPVTSAAVSGGIILKDSSGDVASINVTSGATAGYVMLLDAAAVPADGAVRPIKCVPLAANTGLDMNFRSAPVRVTVGAVLLFSTTGCYAAAKSATAYLSGEVQ